MTQRKQKKLKENNAKTEENMGYLPRVFFFNAFQLGTESKNQVFSSEEASKSITSSKTQLVTIGTLDTPEDEDRKSVV